MEAAYMLFNRPNPFDKTGCKKCKFCHLNTEGGCTRDTWKQFRRNFSKADRFRTSFHVPSQRPFVYLSDQFPKETLFLKRQQTAPDRTDHRTEESVEAFLVCLRASFVTSIGGPRPAEPVSGRNKPVHRPTDPISTMGVELLLFTMCRPPTNSCC